MGETITYPCPDGSDGNGYLARADAPKGGVVVLQEWWGLTNQIKGVANRLAAAGYTALAPDLYDGYVTQDADEANHMMTGLDWRGAARRDVRGAVQQLKKNGGKAAVMGFCMGGALTVISGVTIPECDAAVCYYGIPPKEDADPAAMKVPFMGHFATADDWCTPEAVTQLRRDMADVTTPVEIFSYEGDHAFFNQARPEVYVEDAAEQSWARTIDFLNRTIG